MEFPRPLNVWYLAADEKEMCRLQKALKNAPVKVEVTHSVDDLVASFGEDRVVIQPFISTFAPQFYADEGISSVCRIGSKRSIQPVKIGSSWQFSMYGKCIEFSNELLIRNTDPGHSWYADSNWRKIS